MASWRKLFQYKIGCVPIGIIHGIIILTAYQFLWKTYLGAQSPKQDVAWESPAADRTWPWQGVVVDRPRPGVTHWRKTATDGTGLELIRFDFSANPRLRFEMYDQDQDAPQPWTNRVRFFGLGVTQATAHLDAIGRGQVIAATNGMFFHSTGDGPEGYASHVSPVVVDGEPHLAGGENVRWTFGVKYIDGKPHFDAYHTPDRATLAAKFDFAAGGAQVLIWDGVVAASPAEHMSYESAFESMRTSRVAWGWSRDSRLLYLLFVKEPDSEIVSKIAAKRHIYLGGGWMLSDERSFFQSLGVWRAFNSDAGDVAQMLLLRGDGKYDLVPPKTNLAKMRQTIPADSSGGPNAASTPRHGSLMYWYVREVP
jgi:hypothetical protein